MENGLAERGSGLSYRTIARNLNVDGSTVFRVVRHFNITGSVHPKCRSATTNEILTDSVKLIILTLVLTAPEIYLREIVRELEFVYGVEVNRSTICRFLKNAKFSHQKMRLIAINQSKLLRERFFNAVSLYLPHTLIFVDEMGSDRRDAMRTHGYSLRGKPMTSHKICNRGKHLTAIAGMNCSEILSFRIVEKSVDSMAFVTFIEKDILPKLMPFNGTNPNSVVVMDTKI